MPLDELSRETIEAFRSYVEDSVAIDDRYEPAERHDREDESMLATRFAAGPACWFEVVVRPLIPQIRVGFLTNDRQESEEIVQAVRDSDQSIEAFVGLAFGEAGLDWKEPPVEHYDEGDGYFHFATPLDLDELRDVDLDEIRAKTLRMLDGYLIAFGPAIEQGELGAEDEEDED